MASLAAALIGLACGVLLAVVWFRFTRRGGPDVRPAPPAPSPRIPDAVVAELSVGAVALDESDDVVLVNRAAYTLGIVRDNGTLTPDLRKLVRQVRKDGVRREIRHTLPAANLTRRPVPLQIHALSLGGQDVAVIAEDVTELERVESIRRDFVANIGHEIKTPVGAISLLAEAALDAGDDQEAVQRFLRRLQLEAGRLSQLVQELIELMRIQGGEPLPALTPVSLDDVIDEAIDRVRAAAEAKAMSVDRGGDRGLVALGSHAHLVTAIGNLLDNAVTYSAERTRVGVGLRQRDDAVEIAVSDEGIGIARDDLDRIFERFYRSDPARSRETGGTGLGLAIVKHVVGNHGGEVTVASRVGSGTTFTIRLPLEPTGALAPVVPVQEVSS